MSTLCNKYKDCPKQYLNLHFHILQIFVIFRTSHIQNYNKYTYTELHEIWWKFSTYSIHNEIFPKGIWTFLVGSNKKTEMLRG